MRQTGVESIAEASAEREIQGDETQRGKQSAGRDETRVERETQSERETTSKDNLKLELVRRALSATAFVVLHVESDLHEHANGCRKRRTSSACCAAHSSSSREQLHKARACNNTAYSDIIDCLTDDILSGDILLAILFTGDIIDWRYFAWRYIAGDIIYWRYYRLAIYCLAIYCWRYFAGDISSVNQFTR